ncbi:hypothetical protein SLA2020_378150 [Shorea laevis]
MDRTVTGIPGMEGLLRGRDLATLGSKQLDYLAYELFIKDQTMTLLKYLIHMIWLLIRLQMITCHTSTPWIFTKLPKRKEVTESLFPCINHAQLQTSYCPYFTAEFMLNTIHSNPDLLVTAADRSQFEIEVFSKFQF